MHQHDFIRHHYNITIHVTGNYPARVG